MIDQARKALANVPASWRVREALPTGPAEPLSPGELPAEGSLAVPAGKVLFVVNDAQRGTPTAWLLRRFALEDREGLFFAVASGSHRPPDEAELAAIFGPSLESVCHRLILHDARGEHVFLGTTARGTPVEVNPCLLGQDAVICLGSVEPHYFAGWTGGRKSVVPGLASLETMRRNHRLAMKGGVPGRPETCPVAQDLDDALRICASRLGREYGTTLWGVNTVSRGGSIYGCFRGPLEDTLDALSPAARRLYGRLAEGTADIVVALVEPPLDRDLYQALKAFENWKRAVAPGGVLVLAADCLSGVGPPTFVQFLHDPPALAELRARPAEAYRLGDHKLANFLSFRESGRNLALVSGAPFEDVRGDFRVHRSLADFLRASIASFSGTEVSVLIAENAAETYPVDLLQRGSL
jgi:nickel-dependent lactate racemase